MSIGLTILTGDCVESMRGLPAGSVDCCVTSPPYFGLRDYGHPGQIGIEATPAAFVAKMVEVFAEVHRVLRDDGTLWLNLGDSYAGSGRGVGDVHSRNLGNSESRGVAAHRCRVGSPLPAGLHANAQSAGSIGRAWVPPPAGFKNKDLLGIPWRVAFALQDFGWYLRSEIIWHKPNPMPESVTDRPTKAHETIFLLSKSTRYFYDFEAIKERAVYGWKDSEFHTGKTADHQQGRASKKRGEFAGKTNELPGREAFRAITETRNKRSVWTVPSSPYRGAHFATFPPDLIKPCIMAGCPVGGVVLDPFGGSGTTGAVALELGRSAVLCELNPAYVALIKERCAITPGLPLTTEPSAFAPPAPLRGHPSVS